MVGHWQLSHPMDSWVKLQPGDPGIVSLDEWGLTRSRDQDVRKSSSSSQSLNVKGEGNLERDLSHINISHQDFHPLSAKVCACYWTKLRSAHLLAVRPIYWHWVVVKESAAFIVRHQTRSPGQLMLKKPKLPDRFQESTFKGQVGRGVTGFVMSLWKILW